MSILGHISAGRVVLDQPISLPDGTPVRVELVEPLETQPTLLDRLGDVVGKAVGMPEDSSKNVDHYLYGHAKK